MPGGHRGPFTFGSRSAARAFRPTDYVVDCTAILEYCASSHDGLHMEAPVEIADIQDMQRTVGAHENSLALGR